MAVVERVGEGASKGRGHQKADVAKLTGYFVLRRTLVYSKQGDPGRAEQGNQRGLMYV